MNTKPRHSNGKISVTSTLVKWISAIAVGLGFAGYVGPALLEQLRVTFETPITVEVFDKSTTANYIFSEEVDPSTARFGGPEDFMSWVEESKGILYGDMGLRLEVRGRDAAPVIITGISARVVDSEPLSGAWINGWCDCGGDLWPRLVHVDLSHPVPSVTVTTVGPGGYNDRQEADGRDVMLQVSESDVEVFIVSAVRADGIVSWVLDIEYSSRGKDGTYTVTATNGEPFVLAGGGNPAIYSICIPSEDKLTLARIFHGPAVRGGDRHFATV